MTVVAAAVVVQVAVVQAATARSLQDGRVPLNASVVNTTIIDRGFLGHKPHYSTPSTHMLSYSRVVLLAILLSSSFSLVAAPSLATEGLEGDLKVVVDLKSHAPAGNGEPIRGTVTLRALLGPAETLVTSVEGSTKLTFMVPRGGPWQLSAEIPGWWMAQTTLVVSPQRPVVVYRANLWRSGWVTGSFEMADAEEASPASVSLDFSVPITERDHDAPSALATCPVDEKRTWRCEVPALKLDLAVKPPGFVPHYQWGVDVIAGAEVRLGKLVLRRGASLAGWVEIEDGAVFKSSECQARLVPLGAAGGGTFVQERIHRLGATGTVLGNGFLQIDGIAPGTYVLEVTHPGFAPTRVHPLEIWGDAETYLKEAIVLKRPIDLEIHLRPAVDMSGDSWRVTVHRFSEFSANYEDLPAYSGPAEDSGIVTIRAQRPGDFVVVVADSAGNKFFNQDFVGVGENMPSTIMVDIPVLAVTGTIFFGEEPVAGTLWFGGRYGALKAKMESDSEGDFEGFLPKAGRWNVDVEALEPTALRTRTRVEIEESGDGDAEVEIVLPDTHLFGLVIDGESDRPIPTARVSAIGETGSVNVEADELGEFEIRGLETGVVELHAGAAGMAGPPLFVENLEGQPLGPLELRLRKMKTLRGRVISDRGAVAGSALEVYPHRPRLAAGTRGRSDFDGSFSVEIPEQTETALVVVSPPGHALKVFEVLAGADPVVLFVGRDGGELVVHLPWGETELVEKNLVPVVLQDGRMVSLPALDAWTRGHGSRLLRPGSMELRVPWLAPAEYLVCLSPRMVYADVGFPPWLRERSTCAGGFLGSGEILQLEIVDE